MCEINWFGLGWKTSTPKSNDDRSEPIKPIVSIVNLGHHFLFFFNKIKVYCTKEE